MIPLWALYALMAALCVVVVMLVQERVKAHGFVLAFWLKLFVVLFTLPLAVQAGFPTDPVFYGILLVTAVLYCVSDIAYFHAIPQIGSGLITRIMPGAVVVSFFLWLLVDYKNAPHYFEHPVKSFGIFSAVLMAALSTSFLKKCPVSWSGLRQVWVCLFAGCVGPVLSKLCLSHADPSQASYSYIAAQGVMMLALWLLYFCVRKPVPAKVFLSSRSIKSGLTVGVFSTAIMLLKTQAMVLTDNPAYVSILMYTDALWVIVIYKIIGRKETSNVWAGLGIVTSAVMLIIFKSL